MPPGSIDFRSQDVQLPFVDIAFPEPSETALRELARACQRHQARIESALSECDRVTQQACSGGEQPAALQGRTADTFQQAHEGSTVDTLQRTRDHLVRVVEYLFQAANRVEYIKMSLAQGLIVGTATTFLYVLAWMWRAGMIPAVARALVAFGPKAVAFLRAVVTGTRLGRPARVVDVPKPMGGLDFGLVDTGKASLARIAKQMVAKLSEDLAAIPWWRWGLLNPGMGAVTAGMFDLSIQSEQMKDGNRSEVDVGQTAQISATGATAGLLGGALPVPMLPISQQKPWIYVATGLSSMARNMAISQFLVVDGPRIAHWLTPGDQLPVDRFGTSQAGTGASWAGTTTDLFVPSPVRPFVR